MPPHHKMERRASPEDAVQQPREWEPRVVGPVVHENLEPELREQRAQGEVVDAFERVPLRHPP